MGVVGGNGANCATAILGLKNSAARRRDRTPGAGNAGGVTYERVEGGGKARRRRTRQERRKPFPFNRLIFFYGRSRKILATLHPSDPRLNTATVLKQCGAAFELQKLWRDQRDRD